MELFLNTEERKQLQRLSHNNFNSPSGILWCLTNGSVEPGTISLDSAEAWEWKDAVDNERGFLPKVTGSLRDKMSSLYEKIG